MPQALVKETTGFVRGLNLFDATMIVIGTMIGSGIFIVSADMARLINSPGWLLVAWGVTAAPTILSALSYGELASMLPQAGLVNPVDAACSIAVVDDQAGGLQDLEVLGGRWPGDGQGVSQLAYRAGRGGEPGEDGPPGGVAERGPAIEHVSSH